MAKRSKRSRSGAGQVSSGATPSNAAKTSLLLSCTSGPVMEVLPVILEQLDAVTQEAHVASCKQPPQLGSGGRHSIDASLSVYAAMAAPHFEAISRTVALYGLQLLPSLDDILKRVAIAVSTPHLSSAEAWQALATLSLAYRAGTTTVVAEVMEALLREDGMLLLDAPQFVARGPAALQPRTAGGATATANSTSRSSSSTTNNAADATTISEASRVASAAAAARVAAMLESLCTTLYATGPFLPSVLLQQFAGRLAVEVIDQALLCCDTSDGWKTAQENPRGNSACGVVPAAWRAPCLHLLEACIFLCRPAVPAALVATVSRAISSFTGHLHRGVPLLASSAAASEEEAVHAAVGGPAEYLAVMEAVVRLGHTLQLLRHPVVLPLFVAPQMTAVERVRCRQFRSTSVEPPQTTEERTVAPLLNGGTADFTPTLTPPTAAAQPALKSSRQEAVATAAAVMQKKSPLAGDPQKVEAAKAPLPAASSPQKNTAAPTVAMAPPAPRPSRAAPVVTDDGDDEMPDIVLED